MNRYQTPVQNSLESYVPLPLDGLAKAGAAIQGRYDQNELADTTANTTLSNIRAENPDQQVVVKQMAGQYRDDASALLDKYQHRYDDPGFKREQQSLIQKYSNDPRYAAVTATNAAYDEKAKAISKENEAGNEWFDADPNFKGVSEGGRFNVPTQGIIRSTYAADIAKRAGEYKDSKYYDGTTSNVPQLTGLVDRISNVNDPEFAKERMQAARHQMKYGVPPEQAMAAGIKEITGIVYDRSHTDMDPDAATKRADALANKQQVLANTPYAVTGNSYSAVNFRPDKFVDFGAHQTNILSMAKSSSDKTYEMKAGQTIPGRKWVLGDGHNSSLDSTTNGFTFGDKGGTQLPDEVIGVISDGKYKGKLVATNTEGKDPDGDRSTTAAEDVKTDDYGNTTVSIGRGEPKANVQGQAMHVYQDAATSHKIYVAMNKNESITYLGQNYSGENVNNYATYLHNKGEENFTAMLRGMGMSTDKDGKPNDDFYHLWKKASGGQRTMMNRMIDSRLDNIPDKDGDGLTNIQRIQQGAWGNQGKMNNMNNYRNGKSGDL